MDLRAERIAERGQAVERAVKKVGEAGTKPGIPDGPEALSLRERVKSLRLPEHGVGHRNAWLPWTLCLVLAAALAVLLLRPERRAPEAEQQQAAAEQPSPQGADTSKPATAAAPEGDLALEAKGYIVPVHQIQVSPKVGGMVVRLRFEEGQRVRKGDVLAELETVDYQADRDHAAATLESTRQRLLELEHGNRPEEIQAAKAELEECEAQLEQLFLDWKRNTSLQSGTALATRDYEQAYSQYKAMARKVVRLRQNHKLMVDGPRVEKVDAARAELRLAEAELAKAQWRLDNCTVRAPVTGTILTKKAEEGNVVNPIAFNISASLCEMADLSDLEVDLTIQERDISRVFKGQRCRVRAEAYPDRVYDGSVSRLMPIADRAKGAVPVRVKVVVPPAEEGVYLKPEMGAVVAFLKK
jgi:multidrug resistance efflux pump